MQYWEEDYLIEYQIYAWLDENYEPYYLSKCRTGSTAPYKKRAGTDIQPPDDKARIKTLFKGTDERELIEKLDELHYELGLKDATDGWGKLENKITHSPKALRERSHSKKVEVDVYKVDGEKVGTFRSIGDAVHCLKLNKGNATGALHGRFYQTQGYCILYKNEKFRKRKKGARKTFWTKRKLLAFDAYGTQTLFECIADAAEALTGDRKKTNGIRTSLVSPLTDKKSSKGYVFFEQDSGVEFDEITFATVGRPSNKDVYTR